MKLKRTNRFKPGRPGLLSWLYLVAQADWQLVEGHGMRTVGPDKDLQLDGLVHMETGRLEFSLTLDWWRRTSKMKTNTFGIFKSSWKGYPLRLESSLTEWDVVLNFYRHLIGPSQSHAVGPQWPGSADRRRVTVWLGFRHVVLKTTLTKTHMEESWSWWRLCFGRKCVLLTIKTLRRFFSILDFCSSFKSEAATQTFTKWSAPVVVCASDGRSVENGWLTSAQQLHAVEDVVLHAGHQISAAQSGAQDVGQQSAPSLRAIITHHIVQQPGNSTHSSSAFTRLRHDGFNLSCAGLT